MKAEIVRVTGVAAPPLHQAVAARAGGLLFVAGQMAVDAAGDLAAAARVPEAFPYFGSPIRRQTAVVLDALRQIAREAGASLDRAVKAQVFLLDLQDFPHFDEAWRAAFPVAPARTTLAVPGLLVEGARVLVDLVLADGGERVHPLPVAHPDPGPHASEAVRAGGLVFASGQIATDFATGVAPAARPAGRLGSAIKAQARYVLSSLGRTFEAAGASLADVVKAQVFLRDLHDFPAFDEVWKEFFPTPPPRTTVGVTGLLVPGTLVEIDLVAVARDAPWRPEVLPVPPGVPAPMANYAVGCTVGPWVFAAGQIASDYRTGVPPEARVPEAFPYYGIPIKRQTEYVLGNIDRTLRAAGSSPSQVVRAQVFLQDLGDFPAFEEVWRTFFPEPPPRTVVGTTNLLVPGTLIEIDLIAVR